MKLFWLLLFALPLLSACGKGFESFPLSSQSQSSDDTGSDTEPPAPQPSLPGPTKGGLAVDLSTPVNQIFLDQIKELNVSTVIRYYDHTNETINGKTLRRAERDLILQNGFKIAVVFQHNNNQLSSFTSIRGTRDAVRSLELAQENLQPRGSAIYFGVDGGWSTDTELNQIRQYLQTASQVIRSAGFRMGVYGSGLVCRTTSDENLADLCWLANAKGWPQYQSYFDSQEWSMVQSLPEMVGTFEVDFNQINNNIFDFGQFPIEN
jgi:Domain of unknown function (DUF1906)